MKQINERPGDGRMTTSDAAFLAYLNTKYEGHISLPQLKEYFGERTIRRFVESGILFRTDGAVGRNEAYKLGPNALAVLDFYFEANKLSSDPEGQKKRNKYREEPFNGIRLKDMKPVGAIQ